MRFSTSQFSILKVLATGTIPVRVLRLWNQMPLRGLYVRGFLAFNERHEACITPLGWAAYKACLNVTKRKHKDAPLFHARYRKARRA